jgi:hypothetical protein
MSERDAFGPGLKAERDRCGITLQAIADSTKIGVSLLAALERNDLSRWPKGIFRRAFVREYVTALGLPPEPIVAEFVRLFPDETYPEIPPATISPATELRLTLESEPAAAWGTIRARGIAAAIELSVIAVIGAALASLFDVTLWSGIGLFGLTYYSLASVFVERAPYPRLIVLRDARPVRWLDSAFAALRTATAALRKPRESAPRPRPAEEPQDQAATQEWRTASN